MEIPTAPMLTVFERQIKLIMKEFDLTNLPADNETLFLDYVNMSRCRVPAIQKPQKVALREPQATNNLRSVRAATGCAARNEG
jgi:hypothetical protein